MDALFIVPCMVSPNVNENMIPALTKMIERNILLNNFGLFRDAAIKKHGLSTAQRYGRRIIGKESFIIDDIDNIAYISENSVSHEFIEDSLRKYVLENIINESQPGSRRGGSRQAAPESQFRNPDPEPPGRLFDPDIDYGQESRPRNRNQEEQNRLNAEETRARINHLKAQVKNLEDLTPAQLKKLDIETLLLNKYGDDKYKAEILNINTNVEKAKSDMSKADFEKSKLGAETGKLSAEEREKRIKGDKDTYEMELSKRQEKLAKLSRRMAQGARAGYGEWRPTKSFSPLDHVETPTDITFFKQISLEPSVLEIPITTQQSLDPREGMQTKVIKIGVKCVAYKLDDVKNILILLRESKNMGIIERLFKSAIRKVKITNWFKVAKLFSKPVKINTGEVIDPNQAINQIKYTPNVSELNSAKKLAKIMSSSESTPWSTMIILSSYDLADKEASEIINNYARLTKYVIGDLIVVNDVKESASFCQTKMRSCQEIPFSYLEKVLNLSGVLDYSSILRNRQKAWNKVSFSSLFNKTKQESTLELINKIIKG